MKVSKRLAKNFSVLKKLQSTRNAAVRQNLLKQANKDLVATLIEAVANILNKRVELKPQQRKKLSVHAKDIRNIANCRDFVKGKRLLVQKGNGFLPLLLAPIISAAAGLISDLITK